MPRRHKDAPGQRFLFGDAAPTPPPPPSVAAEPVKRDRAWEDLSVSSRDHPSPPRPLPGSIAELSAQCNLGLIDPTHLGYRPGQVACIADVCAQTTNVAINAPTGSGKTIVALVLAARSLHAGANVLYLTPFDHLVEQTERSAARLLRLPAARRHAIRDDASPDDRAALYAKELMRPESQLLIATPGKLLNDIVSGRFSTDIAHSFGLVIFDECHFAFGDLPYPRLMHFFRERGCRLVGLTGTMGKDSDHRSRILENLGATGMYSLESPTLKRTIHPPVLLTLDDTLTLAAEQLGAVLRHRLDALTQNLGRYALRCGHADVADEAARIESTLLSGSRFTVPVKLQILELQRTLQEVRSRYPLHGHYLKVLSQGYGIDHLQQLHERLTQSGRYAFLALAAEKLLLRHVPELRDAKLPNYLRSIYQDADVLEVYRAVAGDSPFARVLELRTLADTVCAFPDVGITPTSRGSKIRGAILEELRRGLCAHPVRDHPKETELFRLLERDAWNGRKTPTIVFVKFVDVARFLVDRINRHPDLRARAGLFVGQSHKMEFDRAETIRRFEAGELDVIVATSALETGQDTQAAERLVHYTQTSEAISNKQRIGRVGRSGRGGEVLFFVTAHYEERIYFAGRANSRKMEKLD